MDASERTEWTIDLLEVLADACDRGEPIDQSLRCEFPGTAEAASASLMGEIMEADERSAEELTTMKFVG